MPGITTQNISQMLGSQTRIAGLVQTQPVQPQENAHATDASKNPSEEALQKIYQSLFQPSAEHLNSAPLSAKMAQMFNSLSPKEAILMAQLLQKIPTGYAEAFSNHDHQNTGQQKPMVPPSSQTEAKTPLYPTNTSPKNTANTKLPFHLAMQSVQQMQSNTHNLVNNMLGQDPSNDMAKILGPNACFEDVLMHVMMKIARQEEKKVAEKLKILERGHNGLNGALNEGAKRFAGMAGGALGGALGAYAAGTTGATSGAAIGQDLGERLMGSYGYDNSPESRQIQFEKLKHMMQKQSELMTCISNILATIHRTNQNAIGNLRG